jgi:hypothetical protein
VTPKLTFSPAIPSAQQVLRSLPPFPFVGAMVQDLVESLLLCAVLGCALSLVVAGFLSQLTRNFTLLSVSVRVVLVGGPLYLSADYVISEGLGPIASAVIGLTFGLYSLRDWWAPEYYSIALAAGSRVQATMNAVRFARPRRATVASHSLRYRMLSVVDADRRLEECVVDADRRLEQPARDRSLAKAA